MMALSPEFNWLDNSDKISAQPAGNLYHGITRADCLHVDFQGLGEVLRALDASSGAVQISYTSKYCATVFDGDAQTWRGIYSTLGSDEWAQKSYIERWKAVRDDDSLNRREWLDQQWNHTALVYAAAAGKKLLYIQADMQYGTRPSTLARALSGATWTFHQAVHGAWVFEGPHVRLVCIGGDNHRLSELWEIYPKPDEVRSIPFAGRTPITDAGALRLYGSDDDCPRAELLALTDSSRHYDHLLAEAGTNLPNRSGVVGALYSGGSGPFQDARTFADVWNQTQSNPIHDFCWIVVTNGEPAFDGSTTHRILGMYFDRLIHPYVRTKQDPLKFICFSLISRCRDPAWARAHAEGLVVDVVDGRLALRSEDSYAINEVVGN